MVCSVVCVYCMLGVYVWLCGGMCVYVNVMLCVVPVCEFSLVCVCYV